MRRYKRLAGLLLAAALCLSALTGCGGAEGDGLTLAVCAGGQPQSLDPIYATSAADQTILNHLYENLMRPVTDASGGAAAAAALAKSVDMEENHDGTVTYTFKLRGAKWSDGRSVRAGDFVYAWQRLADPAGDSGYSFFTQSQSVEERLRKSGSSSVFQISFIGGNDDIAVFLKSRCNSLQRLIFSIAVCQSQRGGGSFRFFAHLFKHI